MSRVEQLATAARSPIAKFHELRLKYWNKDLDIVCCFEGGDDIEFYLPLVRQHLGIKQNRVGFVNCGGKGLVLNLWERCLESRWNLARLGFFVDRDLDDFINGNRSGPQLYVTDNYSIESNAILENFFDSVWQEIFRLPFEDMRYKEWKTSFNSGGEIVARILFPLFYTAVAVKRMAGGVDFDKIDMSAFYIVGASGSVSRAAARSRIRVDYSRVYNGKVKLNDLRMARSDLRRSQNYMLWLRGKAALVFSIIFFSRMKVALCTRGIVKRCKVRVHFNDDFAISLLCARTQPPESFLSFLGSWASLISKNGVMRAESG